VLQPGGAQPPGGRSACLPTLAGRLPEKGYLVRSTVRWPGMMVGAGERRRCKRARTLWLPKTGGRVEREEFAVAVSWIAEDEVQYWRPDLRSELGRFFGWTETDPWYGDKERLEKVRALIQERQSELTYQLKEAVDVETRQRWLHSVVKLTRPVEPASGKPDPGKPDTQSQRTAAAAGRRHGSGPSPVVSRLSTPEPRRRDGTPAAPLERRRRPSRLAGRLSDPEPRRRDGTPPLPLERACRRPSRLAGHRSDPEARRSRKAAPRMPGRGRGRPARPRPTTSWARSLSRSKR
jgi:hypothetical protein